MLLIHHMHTPHARQPLQAHSVLQWHGKRLPAGPYNTLSANHTDCNCMLPSMLQHAGKYDVVSPIGGTTCLRGLVALAEHTALHLAVTPWCCASRPGPAALACVPPCCVACWLLYNAMPVGWRIGPTTRYPLCCLLSNSLQGLVSLHQSLLLQQRKNSCIHFVLRIFGRHCIQVSCWW